MGSLANGLVAGQITPPAMYSKGWLALASLLMMSVGVFAWDWVSPRAF